MCTCRKGHKNSPRSILINADYVVLRIPVRNLPVSSYSFVDAISPLLSVYKLQELFIVHLIIRNIFPVMKQRIVCDRSRCQGRVEKATPEPGKKGQ